MKAPEKVIFVVSHPSEVPKHLGTVLTADDYLAGGPEASEEKLTVINLCRSWRYLSKGYYVSLLADARAQRVIPRIETVEALSNAHAIFRLLQENGIPTVDLSESYERRRAPPHRILSVNSIDSITPLIREEQKDEWVYRSAQPSELAETIVLLGECFDARFQRLAARIYRLWPIPVIHLKFLFEEDTWKVIQLRKGKFHQLSESQRQQFIDRVVARPPEERLFPTPPPEEKRASIAVLYDPHDPHAPSSLETIDRLERVAAKLGVYVHRIGASEINRLGDYDALFIRSYTGLHTPAFRFALRADAVGMPVIDDVRSIVRCTNKVFLHELLQREGIPTPKTVTISQNTSYEELVEKLGSPVIIKVPDGSFSAAVFKIRSAMEYFDRATELFRTTPLLVAQEYLPTAFDWRVTVLDGRPLFVCKYHMAPGHWQIRAQTATGARYGRVEAIPRDEAPREVSRLACRAARQIGEGLYGVDLKQTESGVVVIEVNDNPNIDIGYDDAAEGAIIYEELVEWYLKRLEGNRSAKPKQELIRDKDPMAALRAPIGVVPERESGRPYYAYEVCGIELEYAVVDRDLNVVSMVGPAFRALAGRATSDISLGVVGFSNEIVDHVLEIKTELPLKSLVESETLLVEGVRRFSQVLAQQFGARLLPTGMHPWFNPKHARLWARSNRKIYSTYARLFDIHTHGWANVQACHVNLPLGDEAESVAMMNAAALLIPYLPAISASTPMFDGELQADVDNRLGWILKHQTRVPESCGGIVPEYCSSLAQYKREILGKMYEAVDKLSNAEVLRREYFNARGAVFKFSRKSMEVRVLDVQECIHMDIAIAAFVRAALKAIAEKIQEGKIELPPHELLVEDFHEVVRHGSRARVFAPMFARRSTREEGRIGVSVVLRELLTMARRKARADEDDYLNRIESVIESGSLSERMIAALEPYISNEEAFTDAARRIYIELSECLIENRPWRGRGW